MQDKLVPLDQAIRDHLSSGSSVVLGACLEASIPFAATYEIIRQGIKELEVIAPISDASTDMLIGAGCVNRVTGAWVGNVSGGLGHNYRRALENPDGATVKLRDYSNFSIGMALMAGAYGMPYVPVRSVLGSDIVNSNDDFIRADNPFSDQKQPLILVPPLIPDVTVLSVQRADKFGNSHFWGSRGIAEEAAFAAEEVIVLAEEIVAPEIISSDPGRVLVPGYRVAAVCHVPAACHPSPMVGYWQRDNDFFNDYHKRSRHPEGFREWLDEWVYGVADHDAYCAKLTVGIENLKISGSAMAAPVNYAAV